MSTETPTAATSAVKRNLVASICSATFASTLLVVGGLQLTACTPRVPACDDHALQEGMKTSIGQTAGSAVVSMTNTRTVSHTDTAGSCATHLTLADGRQADITYALTLNGSQVSWRSEDVPTPLPTCEAANVQALIRQILTDQNHVTVTGLTNFRTVSRAALTESCQVAAAFADGTADLSYTVTLRGTSFEVEIAPATIQPTPGAGPAPNTELGGPATQPPANGAPLPGEEPAPIDQGGGDQSGAGNQGGGK